MAAYKRANPDIGRLWHAKRREQRLAQVNAIKLADGCKDCGYRDNVDALEFDHVRGSKIAPVSMLVTGNIDDLTAEILKCDVRCANCHAIQTAERRRAWCAPTK